MREKSNYSVQSVANATRILEYLGTSAHEQSVADICNELYLTRSNVNKLLVTLGKFGYIDKNHNTGNYHLGIKTFQLSQTYISNVNIKDASFPLLRELSANIGETACTAVLHRKNIVYVSEAETMAAVRVYSHIGKVVPAYATASGKVQLAWLDGTEIETVFHAPFRALTNTTLRGLPELTEELGRVRQLGYAIDNEELEYGVRCLAVPVRNFIGDVIAAVSINAPVERMSDERIKDELLPQILDTAHQLSAKFGYRR
ncbi:IclR family transcriptional regulator [Deferribacterales bacterium RsTz2092]|nr:IclR family transcriptional regulator [Deferribacterales bacterium]